MTGRGEDDAGSDAPPPPPLSPPSRRSPVFLRRGATGELVTAALVEGVTEAEVAAAEAAWRPFLRDALARRREAGGGGESAVPPEHAHWDWARKARRAAGLLAYQLLGVECEGRMQGLMLAATAGRACRLPSQAGKPLVYVDYLAAAPWNLRDLAAPGQPPRFGAVGRVLVAAAITLSIENEFAGRVGLHALPQAEDFYSRVCGMSDAGIDARVEGLRYFEMTPEQAAAFLGGGGGGGA